MVDIYSIACMLQQLGLSVSSFIHPTYWVVWCSRKLVFALDERQHAWWVWLWFKVKLRAKNHQIWIQTLTYTFFGTHSTEQRHLQLYSSGICLMCLLTISLMRSIFPWALCTYCLENNLRIILKGVELIHFMRLAK